MATVDKTGTELAADFGNGAIRASQIQDTLGNTVIDLTNNSFSFDENLQLDGTLGVTGATTLTGALQCNSTVTVGVDDTGYDVQLFGATAGAHMLWDESTDTLKLVGGAKTDCQGTVTVGVDDTGYDVQFFGATSGAHLLWDESADTLKAVGTAGINVTAPTGAGLGYATGAGGAVAQATSRTTGVTLNKLCGAITLVSAAGTTTAQTFTVTNSTVAATDTIVMSQKSGTDLNHILVTAVGAGSFDVTFFTTGGTTTETPVFNFAVIKAVAA